MPTKTRLGKLAALTSSALLMGAFVAWRAGAFEAKPPTSPTKSPPRVGPEAPPAHAVEFFGGSKSAEVFSGSKSEVPIFETPPPAPATPPAMEGAMEGDEEMMPGSKSLIGLPRRPKPAPPPAPPAPSEPPATPKAPAPLG